MHAYRWEFDKTKFISFLIKDETVYNEKYLKTKITHIFTIIKYLKKAFNVFVYQ